MQKTNWTAIAVFVGIAFIVGILGLGFLALLFGGGMMGGGTFGPGGMMGGWCPWCGEWSSGGGRGIAMLFGLFFCILIPGGLLLLLALAFAWMRGRGGQSSAPPMPPPPETPPAAGA